MLLLSVFVCVMVIGEAGGDKYARMLSIVESGYLPSQTDSLAPKTCPVGHVPPPVLKSLCTRKVDRKIQFE